MEEEIWKDIAGYEGLYQVSNLGRIKDNKGTELKQHVNNSGYKYVSLNKPHKLYSVHYLVALAFIENVNNYKCINHIDFDRTNNNVSNLEWCDYQYNNKYSAFKRNKSINQFDLEGNFIKSFSSITEASNELMLDKSTIVKVLKNKRNQTGGYVFSYA